MKLSGRVAIVTGAASGIGRASALTFADEGAKVLVADIDGQRGQETVARILERGHEAVFAQVDVSSEAEIKRVTQDTVARWDRIDILFNNAGVVLVKPLEETTEDEWDRLMSINVKAAFLAIKHVVPYMRRGGEAPISTPAPSRVSRARWVRRSTALPKARLPCSQNPLRSTMGGTGSA